MPRAVLGPGETVNSARLRLSRLQAGHLEAMPWLAEALAPEWRWGDLETAVRAGCGVLIADGAVVVGSGVVLFDVPAAGAASVPFIAVDPARRYRGLGGEAALALERHLRLRRGVRRVFAPVPEGRGLAVYFWLRLGYRPLTRSEAPWPLAGLGGSTPTGIWLLRESA